MGNDPLTYTEATKDHKPKNGNLRLSTKELRENKTWKLVPRSEAHNKKILPCKWVFKTKYNGDGSVEWHKARLVVLGCRQVKDEAYDAVFAPVVRLESLRVLVAIVCIENLECEQMDIKAAFLNGILEEVYKEQPQGLEEKT